MFFCFLIFLKMLVDILNFFYWVDDLLSIEFKKWKLRPKTKLFFSLNNLNIKFVFVLTRKTKIIFTLKDKKKCASWEQQPSLAPLLWATSIFPHWEQCRQVRERVMCFSSHLSEGLTTWWRKKNDPLVRLVVFLFLIALLFLFPQLCQKLLAFPWWPSARPPA